MNIPTFNEPSVSGRVSWFGGPNDPTDSGHTASGGTTKEPGIAIYNRATLGGYWRVTAPNGRTAVLRQTDLGPAPFTGRKVDVTYSALGRLGYNEGNFPTDSTVKATFLGKNPPAEVKTAPIQNTRQAAITGVTGSPAGFNQKGFQEAIQHAAGERAAASLFTGSGEGDAALRQALQKAGTPPSVKTYQGMTEVGGHALDTQAPIQAADPEDAAKLSGILNEANHIAAAKQPYLWGGGHVGKILPGGKVTPLDCSGAVSAALGINPRVSGELAHWGQPGKGQHVTIYANPTHTFLEIDGRFWGTSTSNPGGGAGWIQPGTISPEYLKGFTVRHPEGL